MEPTLSEFVVLFSIATGIMLLLAMAIVFFVMFYQRRLLKTKLKQQQLEAEFQQKMLQATLESQETERHRLAAELHDSIGAMLSTIRLSIMSVSLDDHYSESVQHTKQMIDDTIDSVRRISRDLMPSTLQKFGLTQAITEMCQQYTTVSGMNISIHKEGEERSLDKTQEIMIFRIVQELVNNAMKHSKATLIKVSITWSDKLIVCVEDNGTGFNADEKMSSQGLGLYNMQNRAIIIGADFRYIPDWQHGTKAILTLSLP